MKPGDVWLDTSRSGCEHSFVMGARCLAAVIVLFLVMRPTDAASQSWVAFLHTPPEVQHADVDMQLVGSLIGTSSADEITVRYRIGPTGEYRSVPVVAVFGDNYEAVIPASEIEPPTVEYYVEWTGKKGTQPIFSSAARPHVVKVVQEERMTGEAPDDPGEADPEVQAARAAAVAKLRLLAAEDPISVASMRVQSITSAPAIVSVVSSEDIHAMGARTVADVLKTIPGLETSRDFQGFYRLGVRGIRSDPEILLLYDGHRLTNLYDGRNLYELPVAGIKRIEVIRGPGAVLYGAGAFLAVINIVPSDAAGLEATLNLDGFNVLTGHAGAGMRLGEGLLRIDADLQTGSGFQADIVSDAYGGDKSDPAGVIDDRHLLFHGGVRGVHPVRDGELQWSLRSVYQSRGALGGAFDAVGPDSRLTWLMLLADVRYRTRLGAADFRVRVHGDLQSATRSFHLTAPDFDLGAGSFPDGVIEEVRHATHSVGVEAAALFVLFPGNDLTLGVSVAQEGLDRWFYGVNYDPADLSPLPEPTPLVSPDPFPPEVGALTQRVGLGAFVQDAWTIVDGLELTLGLRTDLFSGGVGREVGQTRGLEVALSPRLGLVWHPTDRWTFKALYATAFRVPTFEELTNIVAVSDFSRGRFLGNSELDPVRIRTAEIGGEHSFGSGEHSIRLRGNGFVNQFLNRIEAVDETGVINRLENRNDSILVYGLEGEGRVDFSTRDRIRVGMAWFRAVDTGAKAGLNLLTDVPQLRLILQSEVGLGEFLDLHVGATFGSERRNNARSTLEALRRFRIGSYALVNASLRTTTIADHFTFAVNVTNVLDTQYLDDVPRPDRVTGLLPRPGLSGSLTVRARF